MVLQYYEMTALLYWKITAVCYYSITLLRNDSTVVLHHWQITSSGYYNTAVLQNDRTVRLQYYSVTWDQVFKHGKLRHRTKFQWPTTIYKDMALTNLDPGQGSGSYNFEREQ